MKTPLRAALLFSSFILAMSLVTQIYAQGKGENPVFIEGDYPNLGKQTPINLPNCTPNANTVVVSNNAQLQPALDNPTIHVICLNPGSYAEIKLDVSGSAQSPRYLIPNHNNNQAIPKPWNLPQNKRVKVDTILFESAYWCVVGLNVVADTNRIIEFRFGASGNVVDSTLVEGKSERLPVGSGNRTMVRVSETTFYNTIQNSVLRNPPRVPYKDSHCLVIRDSQYNTVINNQIYGCPGDGIQINTVSTAGWDNRGNKILDNEIYLTQRLYASCSDTSIDANLNGPGECACAENALDIKHNVESPVGSDQDKMEIRSNHMYGFRKTHPACGGTGGTTGPVICLHKEGAKDILIESNFIANSHTGIQFVDSGNGGPDENSVLNNMFFNIYKKRALHIAGGVNNQFTQNTIVLTLNDGHVSGRQSIAIIGNAGSALISNNLVLSLNESYRGYFSTNSGDTAPFTVQNNGYVDQATPISGLPGDNDMIFPNDPLANYAEYCFISQKHTAGIRLCYSYLEPGLGSATVDTINTASNGVPYDFFYRPRSLPYDLGATEVPIFDFFAMIPALRGN